MSAELKTAQYIPQSPEELVQGFSALLPLRARQGCAFLMAETKKSNADSELVMQTLNDQVHRLANSFGEEANPQHRFEQFLGALNELLATHVREGRWHIPIQHFHACVGIVCDGQMFFSGTGDLTALFLHRKPNQRYQIFNLFRSIQTEQSLPTWEKALAVILDGELHEGDVFCLSNLDVQREIPHDELHMILTTLPPVGAVEKIRQYFPPRASVSLIVLQMRDDKAHGSSTAKPLSGVSVEQMVQQEQEVTEFLEDQKPSPIKFLSHFVETLIAKTQSRSRILRDLQQTRGFLRSLQPFMERVGTLLLHIFKKSLRIISQYSRLFIQHISRKSHHSKGLPKQAKMTLAGIVILSLVLALSLFGYSRSKAKAEELAAYQSQITTIEELMEKASAAVIYKDENQARQLYQTVLKQIELLPVNTPERDETAKNLRASLETGMDEVRHVITVPNPALLGDLASVRDGVFGNSLVRLNDAFVVIGSDKRLYQLDRTQKVFKLVSVESQPTANLGDANEERGNLYALDDRQGVSQFDPSSSTWTSLSTTVPKNRTWLDLVGYAGRIYLLETRADEEPQVVRYTISGSSLNGATDWITSRSTSLAHAVGLAVDGTVFVAQKDGSIVRFANGAEVGWNADVVDPALSNVTRIWTDENSAYLYLIEPETKRLVVFEKETGAFVSQYRSEAFAGLTDFSIDEKDYTMYLLVSSKLYSIAASHLK